MPKPIPCTSVSEDRTPFGAYQDVPAAVGGLSQGAHPENFTDENEQRLRAAFAEVLCLPTQQITDEIAYDKTSSWDSVAHLALVAAIDTTFDITMDTDDVIDMSSYGRAREILRKYGVAI